MIKCVKIRKEKRKMKFIKDKLEEMENNLDKRKYITQEMRIKT